MLVQPDEGAAKQATALKMTETHLDMMFVCLSTYICTLAIETMMDIQLEETFMEHCSTQLLCREMCDLHTGRRCTTRVDSLVDVWIVVAYSFENVNACCVDC